MKLTAVLKRSLAFVLVLCICMSFMNLSVFAGEADLGIVDGTTGTDTEAGTPGGEEDTPPAGGDAPSGTDPVYQSDPDTSILPSTEECICETKCTEEEVNADCPVCGVEGADLTLCVGALDITSLLKGAAIMDVGGTDAVDTVNPGKAYDITLTFRAAASEFLKSPVLMYPLPEAFANAASATVSVSIPDAESLGYASLMALSDPSIAAIKDGIIKITLGEKDTGTITAAGEKEALITVKVSSAVVPADTAAGSTSVSFSETVMKEITVSPESAADTTSEETGDIGTESDLKAIIASTAAGGVVLLEKDYEISDRVYIGKDLTIDLNGHTLTAASSNKNAVFQVKPDVKNQAITVTIQNGSMTSLSQKSRAISVEQPSIVLNVINVTFSNFLAYLHRGDGFFEKVP